MPIQQQTVLSKKIREIESAVLDLAMEIDVPKLTSDLRGQSNKVEIHSTKEVTSVEQMDEIVRKSLDGAKEAVKEAKKVIKK